jgi:addiction module HigA family antidote
MGTLGYGSHPTHPGEILKDEIEARGISQRKLASRMGIAYSVLNEILNARRPMTEKTALLFEAALGIDAEPLINAPPVEVQYADNPRRQNIFGAISPSTQNRCRSLRHEQFANTP